MGPTLRRHAVIEKLAEDIRRLRIEAFAAEHDFTIATATGMLLHAALSRYFDETEIERREAEIADTQRPHALASGDRR